MGGGVGIAVALGVGRLQGGIPQWGNLSYPPHPCQRHNSTHAQASQRGSHLDTGDKGVE